MTTGDESGGDLRWRVPEAAAGTRVDRYVAGELPGTSRSALSRWISDGLLEVDGRAARASLRLAGGEEVRLRVPPPAGVALEPEPIPLEVVHEDASLLVVNKPPGLVVHPGAGVRSGTLVNALLHYLGGDLLETVGSADRPGIVHRLDRGTSGVLVVAKTPEAHARLSACFARREVYKEYLAIVVGVPADPEGRIDRPIGRSARDRTRRAVDGEGARHARTRWRRAEAFGRHAAALELTLETGRTHQARVHAAALGHPIVGDATYGGGRERSVVDPRVRALLRRFPRAALHARRLGFPHPVSGGRLLVEAPVPQDMAALMERLRCLTGSF